MDYDHSHWNAIKHYCPYNHLQSRQNGKRNYFLYFIWQKTTILGPPIANPLMKIYEKITSGKMDDSKIKDKHRENPLQDCTV